MTAMRMWVLNTAVVVLIGIWLTGFDKVHWVLYLPVVALTFAAATGFCPVLIIWAKLGFSKEPLSCDLPDRKK
jgi:hypothetical protein